MSVNKSPKKVIDWIKYKNIKDATINNSALKGLKRVNKILLKFLKISVISLTLYFSSKLLYIHYQDVFFFRIKNLENSLNSLTEDQKKIMYLNNHMKLNIEYGYAQEMDKSEDKTGITYYREKLLSKASGLVLETCCGSFRNKNFYPNTVTNVNYS